MTTVHQTTVTVTANQGAVTVGSNQQVVNNKNIAVDTSNVRIGLLRAHPTTPVGDDTVRREAVMLAQLLIAPSNDDVSALRVLLRLAALGVSVPRAEAEGIARRLAVSIAARVVSARRATGSPGERVSPRTAIPRRGPRRAPRS